MTAGGQAAAVLGGVGVVKNLDGDEMGRREAYSRMMKHTVQRSVDAVSASGVSTNLQRKERTGSVVSSGWFQLWLSLGFGLSGVGDKLIFRPLISCRSIDSCNIECL